MNQLLRIALVIILTCVSLSPTLYAQPEWQWAIRGDNNAGYSGDRISDMTTDANGNVYIISDVNTQGDIHGESVTTHGMYDIVVASFTCDGAFRWKKIIGSPGEEVPCGIMADSMGGIYVLGNTKSNASLHVDNDTLLVNNNRSIFIIKYDTSGTFEWIRLPQAETLPYNQYSISYGTGMDVDGSGNIFVFATLLPGQYGDGSSYTVDSSGVHILKYNYNGLFLGGLRLNMTTSSISDFFMPTKVPKMKKDHIRNRYYFCGYGRLPWNPNDYFRIGTTKIFPNTAYVVCYDGMGSMLWLKQSSVGGLMRIYQAPVIDPQGNIYIGGTSANNKSWDGYTFTNSYGNSEVPFVMKKDLNGNNVWVVNGSGLGSKRSAGIGFANNTVLLHGQYSGIIDWGNGLSLASNFNTSQYLTRFNAQTGTALSLDFIMSSHSGDALVSECQMVIDNNGNALMSAAFNTSVSVGDTNLHSVSNYDWMVAKFGIDNCNCTIPQAVFTSTSGSGTTVDFTYTGAAPYTTITWDFGDGSSPSFTANPSHTYTGNGNYTVCVTVTNDCGSHTYCNPEQVGTTGINDIPGFAEINIYPNPATNSITIEHAPIGTVAELYSATGQRLLLKTINNAKEQLDIHSLPQGIYLIRLTDKNGYQGSTRFVKH